MYVVLNNEIEAEVGLGFHEISFKGGGHSASVHTRALDPPSCLEGGCDGSDSSNHFVIINVKVTPTVAEEKAGVSLGPGQHRGDARLS